MYKKKIEMSNKLNMNLPRCRIEDELIFTEGVCQGRKKSTDMTCKRSIKIDLLYQMINTNGDECVNYMNEIQKRDMHSIGRFFTGQQSNDDNFYNLRRGRIVFKSEIPSTRTNNLFIENSKEKKNKIPTCNNLIYEAKTTCVEETNKKLVTTTATQCSVVERREAYRNISLISGDESSIVDTSSNCIPPVDDNKMEGTSENLIIDNTIVIQDKVVPIIEAENSVDKSTIPKKRITARNISMFFFSIIFNCLIFNCFFLFFLHEKKNYKYKQHQKLVKLKLPVPRVMEVLLLKSHAKFQRQKIMNVFYWRVTRYYGPFTIKRQ